MNRRPRGLDLFVWILVGIALSFPVQIMILYGHTPLEMTQVFYKLPLTNWVVAALALINTFFVLRASTILKYTLPFLALAVMVNNFLVGWVGDDYSMRVTTLSTIGFFATHIILMQPAILALINCPERRWWMTPIRRKIPVVTFINPLNGPAMKAETFDISETGAFFPMTRLTGLNVGDRLMLSFSLGSLSRFRCEAQVVRTTSGAGQYPPGVGVRFDNMRFTERYRLRRYIQSHVTT